MLTASMRGRMRGAVAGLVVAAAVGVGSAFADASDKDRRWEAFVAEAKAQGGVETVLDGSASYVFRAKTGGFVTVTRLLNGKKRAVCLIAEDEKRTICVDWDTGAATFGQRADAASPWTFADKPPGAVDEPGPMQKLMSGFMNLMMSGMSRGYSHRIRKWYRVNPSGSITWLY